jgi:hypothetical protein
VAADFRPILFLKKGCPFCFKLRVFLLDAGLLDRFELQEFEPGSAEDRRIHATLSAHFDKVSFPAAEIAPGRYEKDSDNLISTFARQFGVDPARLGTYQEYVTGPFSTLMTLFKENKELKQGAA